MAKLMIFVIGSYMVIKFIVFPRFIAGVIFSPRSHKLSFIGCRHTITLFVTIDSKGRRPTKYL